jgi:hypothetical protein
MDFITRLKLCRCSYKRAYVHVYVFEHKKTRNGRLGFSMKPTDEQTNIFALVPQETMREDVKKRLRSALYTMRTDSINDSRKL